MTTGKPQMANPSNASDDLIAELSKLMAQDAQGGRQDAAPPKPAPLQADLSPRPSVTESPVKPFAVRIPGAAADAAPSVGTPAQPPHLDFGSPVEPVATMPRQEPSFAAAPAAPKPTPAPAADSTADPAPFNFDFNFGQQRQQPAPAPVPPVSGPVSDADHDTIADLIAAELMGHAPPAAPAPVNVAPVEPIPVEPAAVLPEPAKTSEAPRIASWSPTPVSANSADRPAPARPALRPVNLTPIHRVEKPQGDSFRIAPVFGLGTTPSPEVRTAPASVVTAPVPEPVAPTLAPVAVVKPRAEHGYLSPVPAEPVMAPPANDVAVELDPIDEIESLIGRAVRVELDNPHAEPQRPLASPALRTLATPTPTAPLPMTSRSNQRAVSGADEAILAAAAATGAEVGWVDHDDEHQTMVADEPRRKKDRAPRRAGAFRAFAGPLVAVALLLAAGFGLYSVLGLGGSDAPAPVLVADTAPIKQTPEAKSPAEPLQQSIVFNEIDGVVPGAEEQLVSRDQADVNEVTAIPPVADVSEEGLANRKVRTVTVRPDGTIVSGENSVAGAAILPVDRPNVPVVPGAGTASSALLASANAAPPTAAITPAPAVAAAPAATTVAPLVPGTQIAVIDATGAPVAGKTAPVPYVRPASVGDAPATGPVNAIIDTPQASAQELGAQPALATLPQPAPQQTLATTTPPTTAPAATAGAYAQLSSQRSEADARRVAADLQARYASILNGAPVEITRADLGERGVYYRVRVPAATQQGAAQFCASVVATGGDCVAM